MMVKQISLFLENKEGRLARVCRILGDAGINIRALSIADTSNFGVLRLIVNQPDTAYNILKQNGFVVDITEVIAVEVPDQPGGLAGTLEILEKKNINVEYMYAFLGTTSQDALVILRVENIAGAVETLEAANVKVLEGEEVYSL
ncbi:MAG: ACT domain-containing protein [Bacillota bacterium]|uniref:ACT domain-containing protein n=1 Tax=Thermanaerosceptrum fracticalcis TaxID=1712410 RepID=A0A7G6E8R2_THEFR|nr:ACT domain-containing protein [Thermanaerosceptrum fracticalcis]QNB48466.1 ACT domain-containing protein [Thermanaerosceptrum fracticalcis]